MALSANAGTTPLDRFRNRLDLTCRECGYEDADGRWTAATSGARITYQHVCPSCAAVWEFTYRLHHQ